jgi:hypothetical protein
MGRKKTKIFELDYLINAELTEDDLYFLFDTKSLLYSLVIGMHRIIGNNKSNEDIIDRCKKDDFWFSRNKWNDIQKNKFTDDLEKMYHNLYQYGPVKSRQLAEWWVDQYGFSVKKK